MYGYGYHEAYDSSSESSYYDDSNTYHNDDHNEYDERGSAGCDGSHNGEFREYCERLQPACADHIRWRYAPNLPDSVILYHPQAGTDLEPNWDKAFDISDLSTWGELITLWAWQHQHVSHVHRRRWRTALSYKWSNGHYMLGIVFRLSATAGSPANASLTTYHINLRQDSESRVLCASYEDIECLVGQQMSSADVRSFAKSMLKFFDRFEPSKCFWNRSGRLARNSEAVTEANNALLLLVFEVARRLPPDGNFQGLPVVDAVAVFLSFWSGQLQSGHQLNQNFFANSLTGLFSCFRGRHYQRRQAIDSLMQQLS